jgi:hypothetical protein
LLPAGVSHASGLRLASETTLEVVFCGDSPWPAPAFSHVVAARSAARTKPLRQHRVSRRLGPSSRLGQLPGSENRSTPTSARPGAGRP